MADFRKLFLVLTALAVLAVPVSAQTVSCSASSAPVLIRAGGLTELVGDVILECTNGTADNRQTNITLFLNSSPVTNKVENNTGLENECAGPNPIKCLTDSVALVYPKNEPVPASTIYITGLLQKRLDDPLNKPENRNGLLFSDVVLPAGTTTIVRLTNVRATADQLLPNGTQSLLANVSTSNGVVITTNNVVPVASAQIPLQFQTTKCDGTAASIPTFQQCVGHNAVTSSMTTTFNVQFLEGFALAFKPRINTASPVFVGTQYLSESGFLPPTADLPSPKNSTVHAVGQASIGTNLIVTFTGIPAGVQIFVTNHQTVTGTSQINGGPAIQVKDLSGSSAFMSCDLTNTNNNESVDQGMASTQVAIDSSGTGKAVWEVSAIDADFTTPKTISFGVAVSYIPQTSIEVPGLTDGAKVEGSIGPMPFTNAFATPLASSAPIPRFRDNRVGATVFAIIPCVTNILFPYVTIKAGFDTGIALVNTSLDNYSAELGPVVPATETQHGYCKMYYFDGTDTPPATQKSCDIKAGGMTTFSMMTQGGIPSQTCADGSTVTNVAVPIGWQGYAIASCRFQYGRGYAFISDRNTPSLGSQGYLPLILPACTRGRSPNPFDAQPQGDRFRTIWNDCGESLAH